MIYHEDVQEASMFFPEQGEVILLVGDRKLLPYVRRELTRVLNVPSTTGEVYSRYGGLKVYTLVVGSAMLEGVLRDVEADMYYVRERGERMVTSGYTDLSNDIALASMCLPEPDMLLYIDNKYPLWREACSI